MTTLAKGYDKVLERTVGNGDDDGDNFSPEDTKPDSAESKDKKAKAKDLHDATKGFKDTAQKAIDALQGASQAAVTAALAAFKGIKQPEVIVEESIESFKKAIDSAASNGPGALQKVKQEGKQLCKPL